jgi:predicted ribonuclease YlaK
MAEEVFKLPCKPPETEKNEAYTGWIDTDLTDEQIAAIYERPTENTLGLLTNQYAVIRDKVNHTQEAVKWNGEEYVWVKIPAIKSKSYGTVKPYYGDIYQQMALDSLSTNQVTMLKGPAGTGKSFLALGYLFYLLEKGRIDKIIVFANPVAVGDACQLGFYPGDKNIKLMDSQTGNMLIAKIGDRVGVERMIDDGQLELLAMADIRGFDTTKYGPVGVYITEAQNFSVNLMKLALQRIGEEAVVIIDGDYNAQVDRAEYAGSNNGMIRMSEVFRGKKPYGEVELKNIYRSEIARIAQEM